MSNKSLLLLLHAKSDRPTRPLQNDEKELKKNSDYNNWLASSCIVVYYYYYYYTKWLASKQAASSWLAICCMWLATYCRGVESVA
jgi:hypothetical protein